MLFLDISSGGASLWTNLQNGASKEIATSSENISCSLFSSGTKHSIQTCMPILSFAPSQAVFSADPASPTAPESTHSGFLQGPWVSQGRAICLFPFSYHSCCSLPSPVNKDTSSQWHAGSQGLWIFIGAISKVPKCLCFCMSVGLAGHASGPCSWTLPWGRLLKDRWHNPELPPGADWPCGCGTAGCGRDVCSPW